MQMVGDDSLRPKKGRECMEDEIGDRDYQWVEE